MLSSLPRQMPSTFLHTPASSPGSKEITLSNEFGEPSVHFSFSFRKGDVHFSLLDAIWPKHCQQCVLLMFSCIILYPETPGGDLRSESTHSHVTD